MVHIIYDHMEDRLGGRHTLDLKLARIGKAVSRLYVLLAVLAGGCRVLQKSNGV